MTDPFVIVMLLPTLVEALAFIDAVERTKKHRLFPPTRYHLVVPTQGKGHCGHWLSVLPSSSYAGGSCVVLVVLFFLLLLLRIFYYYYFNHHLLLLHLLKNINNKLIINRLIKFIIIYFFFQHFYFNSFNTLATILF